MRARSLDQTNIGPVATKIRALMDEEFITEAELSRQTQIPQATLHKVLAGKTADPRCSTLSIIASHFNVSVDYLVGGARNQHLRRQVDVPVQSIPVLSWHQCLDAAQTMAEFNEKTKVRWLVTEFMHDQAYALVTRNSMQALFANPTTLIINPEQVPSDGDLVVVHYPNTEEATLRRFASDGPVTQLSPINDLSEPEELTDDIRILGVVAQARSWRDA